MECRGRPRARVGAEDGIGGLEIKDRILGFEVLKRTPGTPAIVELPFSQSCLMGSSLQSRIDLQSVVGFGRKGWEFFFFLFGGGGGVDGNSLIFSLSLFEVYYGPCPSLIFFLILFSSFFLSLSRSLFSLLITGSRSYYSISITY